MKILIHRKDNIGDAVLSLPLIQVLRRHWPNAQIDYWGPSYVSPVMAWCEELTTVKSYKKPKHAEGFFERLESIFLKFSQLRSLRLERYDLMIYIGNGSTSYAVRTIRFVQPKRALAFTSGASSTVGGVELVHSPQIDRRSEYLEILKLASALNIPEPHYWTMPLLRPPSDLAERRVPSVAISGYSPTIGIHLSARRIRQQWPIDNFESLIRSLSIQLPSANILVTWSPGRRDDRLHPGDDEKARELAKLVSGPPTTLRVHFRRTATLEGLLTVQSTCDVVFCSDGGAMHLAAALGKPVVAMFGDSDHVRWRPIGDCHRVITTKARDVREIDVALVSSEICTALSDGCA